MQKEKNGLILLYTGNGKGKTTAAFGQALRALGHGMKVCMIQFIKGKWSCGEEIIAERFSDNFKLCRVGKGFTWESKDLKEDKEMAIQGWRLAVDIIKNGDYSMLILDELTYLSKFPLVDPQEILDVLKEKPPHLHIIITGRSAPNELINLADIVTEMKEIKHPLKCGIYAQKGIEF
ncbi:MAG: cob(I)yrinic acid a,c-diamide adenosyltransferase [bacterium]